MPQTEDNPAFQMIGTGTWTFDQKEHVPHALDMNYKLTVTQGNTSATIPISVKYTRISAAELAQIEAAAKQEAEERARAAADAKAPKDPDPEVVAAIEKLLDSENKGIASGAHAALLKWSPAYQLKKSLAKAYEGPAVLKSTGLAVESITPLYVGVLGNTSG